MRIKKTFEIELLGIADKLITYDEAKEYCKQLGGRIPTLEELSILYLVKNEYKKEIPQSGCFWSSAEYTSYYAWYKNFGNGYEGHNNKSNQLGALCVK